MEEVHIPGQTDAEITAEEPKPLTDDAPKEPEAETPKEPAADDKDKTTEKPPESPENKSEPEIKKPRSIYDDHKETKHKLKETRTELESAQARITELEGLVATQKEAESPKEKSKAAADIQEYAKKHGLDADSLDELTNVILSKVPKAEMPLTPEEADEWRKQNATAKQREEDQSILSLAPSIKTQLAIHDDAELQTVMSEIVRLAHTPEYHDKEVDYIVWRNRDALSKLVSPKKPSFESGGQNGEGSAEEVALSPKATPMQAQKAIEDRGRSAPLEIRRGS